MTTINANVAIGYNNLANGKTITVTSAQTGYPGANLNEPRLMQRHRGAAAALTSFNYDVDLASAQSLECMALLGTNFTNAATRSPVLSNASDYTSPTYNPGSGNVFDTTYVPLMTETPVFGRHLITVFNTPTASRYARLTVTDTGNADNYLQAGVWWASKLWQPTYSLGFDWKPGRPVSGSPGLERSYRTHRITLRGLTLQQRVELDSLWGANLRTGRLLFIARPSTAATWQAEAIYCTFAEQPDFSPMFTAVEHWIAVLDLVEVVN